MGERYEWTPRDFRSVVATVTSARGDALDAMTEQLARRGFLSCPPPGWDPEGVYRVALAEGRPEVQRLDERERWSATRLTPAAATREKHQKFRVLDAPHLLASDLRAEPGPLGFAAVYLDIDGFKSFNTRFTERVVDRTLLPDFHRLVDGLTRGHGHAYAEGGDEVIVLLHNASELLAVGFAETVREAVERHPFAVDGARVQLTTSLGLACSAEGHRPDDLPELANRAKAHAKRVGKNVVCVTRRDGSVRPTRVRADAAPLPGKPWKGMFVPRKGP